MSCPSSIQHQDSNPQPLERESLPITTRPGLPPYSNTFPYKESEYSLVSILSAVRTNIEPTSIFEVYLLRNIFERNL